MKLLTFGALPLGLVAAGFKEHQISNDYELVNARTGREIFRGTFPQCNDHLLNDAMTMVFSHEAAVMYRKEVEEN